MSVCWFFIFRWITQHLFSTSITIGFDETIFNWIIILYIISRKFHRSDEKQYYQCGEIVLCVIDFATIMEWLFSRFRLAMKYPKISAFLRKKIWWKYSDGIPNKQNLFIESLQTLKYSNMDQTPAKRIFIAKKLCCYFQIHVLPMGFFKVLFFKYWFLWFRWIIPCKLN